MGPSRRRQFRYDPFFMEKSERFARWFVGVGLLALALLALYAVYWSPM